MMVEARALRAGLAYCTLVFAVGFVLGVVRMLWVTPLAGEFIAVAVEAPILLAIAWHGCGWLADQLEVTQQFIDRLLMGGLALLVLVLAEAAAAVVADGQSLAEYLEGYAKSAVLLGLLAQLAFAFFPVLRRRHGG